MLGSNPTSAPWLLSLGIHSSEVCIQKIQKSQIHRSLRCQLHNVLATGFWKWEPRSFLFSTLSKFFCHLTGAPFALGTCVSIVIVLWAGLFPLPRKNRKWDSCPLGGLMKRLKTRDGIVGTTSTQNGKGGKQSSVFDRTALFTKSAEQQRDCCLFPSPMDDSPLRPAHSGVNGRVRGLEERRQPL